MISEVLPSATALKTAGDTQINHALAAGDGNVSEFADQRGRHAAPASEHKAIISAIVESTDVVPMRKAIVQTGGESVGILKTSPVHHSSKVRVFIGMKAGALDSIMTAIMRSVTACEFGRVVRM